MSETKSKPRIIRTHQCATIKASKELIDVLKNKLGGSPALNTNSASSSSIIVDIDEIKTIMENADDNGIESEGGAISEAMDALEAYCNNEGIDKYLINSLSLLSLYYA